MKYLLDTNIVIAFLKGHSQVIDKFRRHHYECVVSSIVMYELYFGAEKSQRKAQNHENIEKLPFGRIDFSKKDGHQAAIIRNDLRKRGTPIGVYDLLIAGQAVNRNLTLITNNVREFSRVDKLKWQDWLTAS